MSRMATLHHLAHGQPWSVLGQSFGGFCAVTYLSRAPEGLREALITGGLPGLDTCADDVYRATYPLVARKTADKQEPEILQDDLQEGAFVLVQQQP